jgi:hypothetical protein
MDTPFEELSSAEDAEAEFQSLLLSPLQRRREKNRHKRQVFVGIRVRPFLPHELALEQKKCKRLKSKVRRQEEQLQRSGILDASFLSADDSGSSPALLSAASSSSSSSAVFTFDAHSNPGVLAVRGNTMLLVNPEVGAFDNRMNEL